VAAMKKEELMSDIINVLSDLSKKNTLNIFQSNLKGENFLLAHLFESGGESTPGRLAEFLNVSAARIAAILRSLETKSLIERFIDGNDKRHVIVKLTEQGKERVNSIRNEMIHHASETLENLGEEDSAELVRILKKIVKNENKDK